MEEFLYTLSEYPFFIIISFIFILLVLWIIYPRDSKKIIKKCNCGDPECKRIVYVQKFSWGGGFRIGQDNLTTYGNFKKQLEKLSEIDITNGNYD
jgi:hypothetical protein